MYRKKLRSGSQSAYNTCKVKNAYFLVFVFIIKQLLHCITRGGQHAVHWANSVERR